MAKSPATKSKESRPKPGEKSPGKRDIAKQSDDTIVGVISTPGKDVSQTLYVSDDTVIVGSYNKNYKEHMKQMDGSMCIPKTLNMDVGPMHIITVQTCPPLKKEKEKFLRI